MQKTAAFSSLFLLFAFMCGSPVLTDTESLLLNGTWQFRLDRYGHGEDLGWFEPEAAVNWQPITVPGSYNEQLWYGLHYYGKAWYKTTFFVPELWESGPLFLDFWGVTIRCKVWLNGQLVGEHLFPYTQFSFDVTPFIDRHGENTLVVQVDNEILERAIPDVEWDGWWNYGGITRDVILRRLPHVYTDDFVLQTTLSDSDLWQMYLETRTINTLSSKSGSIDVEIWDGEELLWQRQHAGEWDAGETRLTFEQEFSDITPWSPEMPQLYDLVITTRAGEIEHVKRWRFGFRQIEAKGTQLLLNKKPLVVKGISRHEQYPELGSSVNEALTRLDLQDIKELGCNVLRTTHYSQHPYVYAVCDELGLLVWDEIPAWKTDTDVLADDEVWETYGKPQLRELVQQNRNRTCVFMWSVGNEFRSTDPKAATFVKRAAEFVRGLDSTRLVTFASDRHRPGQMDLCFDYVDVISINEYYGWYYGDIYDVGERLDWLHTTWPDKPILVSEVGCGTVPELFNPEPPTRGKDYSEDYQLQFYRAHLDQIYDPARTEYVCGAILWLYNDFKDPHRYSDDHPAAALFQNSKGLVTQERVPKPAYELVQEFFNSTGSYK